MVTKASILVKLAFPLGFAGAIVKSYSLKWSNDIGDFGIWEGIFNGIIGALFLVGFLLYIDSRLFEIPNDLMYGEIFWKKENLHKGSPAIFRQFLIVSFFSVGAGLGFILSAPTFEVSTLGIGMFSFIPGFAGSVLLIGLWRNRYGVGKPDKEPTKKS